MHADSTTPTSLSSLKDSEYITDVCATLRCERDSAVEQLREEQRLHILTLNERDQLRDAVRSYRDAKGRYHTQIACEHLIKLLPENETSPSTGATEKENE